MIAWCRVPCLISLGLSYFEPWPFTPLQAQAHNADRAIPRLSTSFLWHIPLQIIAFKRLIHISTGPIIRFESGGTVVPPALARFSPDMGSKSKCFEQLDITWHENRAKIEPQAKCTSSRAANTRVHVLVATKPCNNATAPGSSGRTGSTVAPPAKQSPMPPPRGRSKLYRSHRTRQTPLGPLRGEPDRMTNPATERCCQQDPALTDGERPTEGALVGFAGMGGGPGDPQPSKTAEGAETGAVAPAGVAGRQRQVRPRVAGRPGRVPLPRLGLIATPTDRVPWALVPQAKSLMSRWEWTPRLSTWIIA